jgi:hypothetical protein
MINNINDIIKDAVSKIPNSSYLRATDNDANISVSDIKLAGLTFALFNNLPSITPAGNYLNLLVVPIEIKFLELADQGDTTVQSDDIRSRLIPLALEVYNTISVDDRISLAEPLSLPTIQLEGNIKLYDSIMTGLTIEFDLTIENVSLCPR